MTRPLLGVICDTLPPAHDPRQGVADRYFRIVPYVDADVVLIPSRADTDAASLVRRLDGVFLTGSPSNVHPHRYGRDDPGAGPFDLARDATAFALIAAAALADKPVLGICRGFQEIAVAHGSTLRRDLDRSPMPHHAGDGLPLAAKFAHRHAVTLTAGGVFARAFGTASLEVNSVHFQGVDTLGAALRVQAVSGDAVVEALRLADPAARVLAVQWHPEWDAPHDAAARTVLRMFGAMLRGATLDEAADRAAEDQAVTASRGTMATMAGAGASSVAD